MNEETRAMLTDISERLIKKFRESLEEEIGKAVGCGGMLLLWHILMFLVCVGIIALIILALS